MRYFFEAALNPFYIAFTMVLLSWVYALVTCKNCRLISLLLGTSLVIWLLFSTAFLPEFLTRRLEDQYAPIERVDKDVRYVVVLGGGQSNRFSLPPNMQLYASSQQRLWEGLRLMRSLSNASLVLSGGAFHSNEGSEALHLKQLAQVCFLNTTPIILEDASRNTMEQSKYLRSVLHGKPFYLVTSAIHMPRAMASMIRDGLHPIAAPTAFTHYWDDERWTKRLMPNAYNLIYTNIAMHEYLGALYYRFRF